MIIFQCDCCGVKVEVKKIGGLSTIVGGSGGEIKIAVFNTSDLPDLFTPPGGLKCDRMICQHCMPKFEQFLGKQEVAHKKQLVKAIDKFFKEVRKAYAKKKK